MQRWQLRKTFPSPLKAMVLPGTSVPMEQRGVHDAAAATKVDLDFRSVELHMSISPILPALATWQQQVLFQL